MKNSLNKNCLPESWKLVTVNDISLRIHYGYTATATNKNTGVKYLRITDVQDNKVDWRKVPFCEIPDNEIEKFVLHKNDLVFARTGGTVGKSFLIKDDVPKNSVFASYLIRIVLSSYIESKFIAYFFQSNNYWSQIELGKTGLKTNVSAQILSKIEFSLPPLPEQRAIVAKVEQLFSELDNGITSLKKAQEQLKVYRQAVLKWAFEGKLTERWRKENKNKLETAEELLKKIKEERQKRYEQELVDYKAGKTQAKPIAPKELPPLTEKKLTELPQLPEGWCWKRIEESSSNIIDCLHSTPRFKSTGKYCIDTTCIADGRILFEKLRCVDEATFLERISRLKPREGDILFAREGTVGTTLVVPENVEFCLGQRLMMFRPLSLINSKYLMYYFQSPFFKSQYKPLIGGTTSPHLNIGDIKLLLFTLCSPEEQRQIIQEIESRLSVTDKLEETITDNLQKAEALRQSILKKAFEGMLLSAKELEAVRKDPQWEPAEKLLEKIKAEKQHLSKGRKS